MDYKVPKYFQIKQDIINAIKSGQYKPGDKVDSESVLKKKYNVSAITVRKAFNDLINEEYLIGVQGVGTFVAREQMVRKLTSLSFSDELLQQGYKIDMQVDKVEEMTSESIANKLHVPPAQTLICVKRIRLANNQPVAYQISYVDSRLLSLEQARRIYETKSFYKTMAEFDLFPATANENYSVKEINDPGIAKLMNLKKCAATFFVKRTTMDKFDRIIEYAETYFNKDWYSVNVQIKF